MTKRARKDGTRGEHPEHRQADTQWVTVQTMSSPTWRRRYFHLLAPELRLYKSDSEADAGKPLTTIKLEGARVSEAYEESAVQGSWKLAAGGKVSASRGRAQRGRVWCGRRW